MNYRGSYRHFLRNAKAAMMAAIEIYNKPGFAYRDECFIIMLLNAWELILKAALSKKGKSVFYPKKRKEPYRTLSWRDALTKAETFFPKEIHPLPVRRNLDLLGTYRDNAIHFYNINGFGSVIYALAQTSIVNFRDLMEKVFGVELEDEITWQLMPLGIKPPIDPIEYIYGHSITKKGESAAVRQFISELAIATKEIEDAKADTARFMTVFKVKLESVKKIEKADVVVGVKKAAESEGPLVVTRTMDPNITHPLRQKEVIQNAGELHGKSFTPYTFQAIAWKYGLKAKPEFCWQAKEGVLTRYSNDVVVWLKGLSSGDIDTAVTEYRKYISERRSGKRK